MIKRICLFTAYFAFNRQDMVEYLGKIFPKEVEIFLFTIKDEKNKFHSKRVKIVDTKCNKYTSFFELRKFCQKNRIERIVNLGALPWEGLAMAFASFFSRTKFICHMLGNPINYLHFKLSKWGIKSFLGALIAYPFALLPEKIIFCSRDITDICKKYLFFARKKIYQLPYFVDTNIFFQKNKKEVRKMLNLPLNKKIVLFVGRIEYMKGSDILSELIKRNSDILFILIGKLMDKNIAKDKSNNLKLFSSVDSKDLVNLYNAADIFVFPSRAEAYGRVHREAMACNVPAIVSDILALRQTKGAIVTKLDIEDFDKQIKKFFSLPEKEKQKLSKGLRELIIKECGFEACKDLYINYLLK